MTELTPVTVERRCVGTSLPDGSGSAKLMDDITFLFEMKMEAFVTQCPLATNAYFYRA